VKGDPTSTNGLTEITKAAEVSAFVQQTACFRRYTDSENLGSRLKDYYPHLYEKLKEISRLFVPTCISLGQNGHYFARFGHQILYNLPPELLQILVNIEYVDKLWLGSGDSYVAVYSNGQKKHDLKGMYSGLGRWLNLKSQVPHVSA
jgi:hypothetical protein